jgi:hypothetical protein
MVANGATASTNRKAGWGLRHGPTLHLDRHKPRAPRTAQYLRRLDEAQGALDQACRLVKDALREIEDLRDELVGHAKKKPPPRERPGGRDSVGGPPAGA